jgi:hypothetical protein
MATAIPRTALLCLTACLAACSAKPENPRADQFAALPDWSGIWIAEGEDLEADVSGYPKSGNYRFPLGGVDEKYRAPFNEAYDASMQAVLPAILSAAANNKIRSMGYPMMMAFPAPLQFLVTPEETTIINPYRDIRHVYTDGRQHLAEEDRWSTWWGDSVGLWEGDTLVIDTVSVRRYGIDDFTKPGMFEVMSIPPLTEQAHYVERLRKTGPDRIEGEFTIEDPVALSQPWIVKVAWKRAPGLDRMFSVDFENDRVGFEDGQLVVEPPNNQ